jgi:nucleotide-binding universal stress UspA family protein
MNDHDDSSITISRPVAFEHLLVATDFSVGADQAIARAAHLPLAQRAKVSLVHVLSDRIPNKARADTEKIARRQLDQAAKSIAKKAASLGCHTIKVTSELLRGQPYVEIIRHARSVAADLIVLGRHGGRSVRDMFLGSTAERVIRAGNLPVLVVSRKARAPYRRPLLAIDMEDTYRSVVTVGLRALGCEVVSAAMVHAYHVPFDGFMVPGVPPGEVTDQRKQYRKKAASRLSTLQASLVHLGMRWQTVIVRGDPRTAILSQAIRRRADLLIVGTHGRSGFAHALLGSVAEWVIQAAACDVLVAAPGTDDGNRSAREPRRRR